MSEKIAEPQLRIPRSPIVKTRTGPSIRGIEVRSIDYVPENERHGKISDQGLFWFLSNFHFFAIAIGFVGPNLGLALGPTVVAASIGILIGTLCQAFHASQGAELGLPQMIQSRAQFGYRGVIVPLLGTLISLLGYNIVAAILISDGLHGLWGVPRSVAILVISVGAAMLAIFGYDWIHRIFRLLFWISLPLFTVLSVAVLAGKAGGLVPHGSGFLWSAFFTQLAAAASFNITAAPYVSDYSRYLPRNSSRWLIIANVFAGSAASAIWLIALGAWLATRMGQTDAVVAVHHAGESILPGLGTLLAAVSILALAATVGTNAYSAMLTCLTTLDSIRSLRATQQIRIVVICILTAVWITLALAAGGSAIGYVNAMLVVMLYFLTPWSAVNLIDFFVLRRGNYAIEDLFTPTGRYGAWGLKGLIAYAAGFLASVPFFVIPDLYTGPIAIRLEGVDVGWLVGLLVSSACYLSLNRR